MSEATRSANGAEARLPYVWDYDIDEVRFRALLEGRETLGRLDRDWAAVRLLEHASWREIRRLMSLGDLVRGWPRWRSRVPKAKRCSASDAGFPSAPVGGGFNSKLSAVDRLT